MSKSRNSRTNLLNFDRIQLERYFSEMGEKPFRASQVLRWIYHELVFEFDRMTNLSKGLRQTLEQSAELTLPELVLEQPASDGVRKWMLRLGCGNCIETVFIPEVSRGTLCISSQVGCTLNCSFCSTATQGFNRNLSTAEIIGQVLFAARALGSSQDQRPITNVVLMGMGEPLLNFNNVISAIRLMMDDLGFGLSKRRITLSTAGLVPGIDKLREHCDVSLAVSLHAPNNELRNQLVPVNKKYPLDQLMAACKRYVKDKPRRRVTFEYVMLEGINDSGVHARQLIRLLQGVPAKINLIPFNPFPGTRYQRSSDQVIFRFQERLAASGIVTITRKTRGEDIDAACGQLVGEVQDRTRRQQRFKAQRIMDIGVTDQ